MADSGMKRVYAVEMRERKGERRERGRERERSRVRKNRERKGSTDTEEVKNNIVCRLEICPRILH